MRRFWHRTHGFGALLPCVLTGFSAYIGDGLRPDEAGKTLRHADGIDKVVAGIDIKLEGQREAILHETRRDEDAFRAIAGDVAMTDGLLAQLGGEVGRDQDFIGTDCAGVDLTRCWFAGIPERERHKIIGFAMQRGSDGARDGLHHCFQVRGRELRLAVIRVVDSVGGLLGRRVAHYFQGWLQFDLGDLRHKPVF